MRARYRFSQATGLLSISSFSSRLSPWALPFHLSKPSYPLEHHYQHRNRRSTENRPNKVFHASSMPESVLSVRFTSSAFFPFSLPSGSLFISLRLAHSTSATSSVSADKIPVSNTKLEGTECKAKGAGPQHLTPNNAPEEVESGATPSCDGVSTKNSPHYEASPLPAENRGGETRRRPTATPPPAEQPPPKRGPQLTEEQIKQLWKSNLEELYGEGNYAFFCALYKDLCEELKRELYTKPPTTFETRPSSVSSSISESTSMAFSSSAASPSNKTVRQGEEPERASWTVQYYPTTNSVVFDRPPLETSSTSGSSSSSSSSFFPNTTAASTIIQEAAASAHVWAYAKVNLTDPPKLNALLTFADWCPVEVFIERQGHILHFSVAANEGGMHMRNVRIYDATMALESPLALQQEAEDDILRRRKRHAGEQKRAGDGKRHRDTVEGEEDPASPASTPMEINDEGKEKGSLLKGDADSPLEATEISSAVSSSSSITPPPSLMIKDIFFGDPVAGPAAFETVRHWFYDGPCLWHLELDFQNELYDLLQDYGITLDWVRWASEWVFYYEHRVAVRWMCSVLLDLIPSDRQGPEEHFLTEEERALLDEPESDWVREPLS